MNINYYNLRTQRLSIQDTLKNLQKSKSEKKDVQDQVNLLKNRLIMLQQEEQKQNKLIKLHQSKIQKLIDINRIKQSNQNNNEKKQFEEIQNNTKRAKIQKEFHQEKINIVKSQLTSFRQTNNFKIKQQQHDNHQKIYKQKLENSLNVQERNQQIREEEKQIRNKLNQFWEDRYNSHEQQKVNTQKENDKSREIQKRVLEQLVIQETFQIEQLQKSLEIQKQLQGIIN